jgi:hypothetical protein
MPIHIIEKQHANPHYRKATYKSTLYKSSQELATVATNAKYFNI